ncbi:MAG TPA: lipopolysaccharide kinase InaA family protein [Syntrophorhabdaceae bacterium]|nr:lipopolysaccharide kinase InaA family protein [Syntrophorhabdaceae bacterium]HNT68656.1 lipopolysaccharide kinase InaA family protein [Syntrophorhabdaceae bacterium]
MTFPERTSYGRFTIYSYGRPVEPSLLLGEMLKGRTIPDKGRGGISVISLNGITMACRQYIHGGLFRAVTQDRFFSEKRALSEADILRYLSENSFPVVRPCYVVAEKRGLTKRLFLITEFVHDASDLLDIWRTASRMKRFRIIKRLAGLVRRLELLGVFHPDLHINNILVTGKGELVFLDFDRAFRKATTADDMRRIFWRLDRYVEKYAGKGMIAPDMKEKVFFLRAYQRLAGYDILSSMEEQQKTKSVRNRIGWRIESFFYGGKR